MAKYVRGITVEIIEDYDVFGTNVKGMTGIVLRPYSIDKVYEDKFTKERIIKHLVYIQEIDEYCEPRQEWLKILSEET